MVERFQSYSDYFCYLLREYLEIHEQKPTDPPDQFLESEIYSLSARNSQADINDFSSQSKLNSDQEENIVQIQKETQAQKISQDTIKISGQPEQSNNLNSSGPINYDNPDETDDLKQSDSEIPQGQNLPTRRTKRDNDANKKFQTIINTILNSKFKDISTKIKTANKGRKSWKGSRYSFVMKLMDILKHGGEDTLRQIYEIFIIQTTKEFNIAGNLTDQKLYLKSMVKFFQESFRIFVEEKEQQGSLKAIYNVPGFKRPADLANGLVKIRNYKKFLQL